MSQPHPKSQYKIVTLNKGTSNLSFFFVPGGPGMSPNCFKEFADKYLKKHTVRSILFTGEGPPTLTHWGSNLKRALKKAPSDILIGHSFGGMLLLATRGLDQLAKGQVILSSAPDLKWLLNITNFKLNNREAVLVDMAEKKFNYNPTKTNLISLWQSWAPFYFYRKNKKSGKKWLGSDFYNLKVHNKSKKILKNYKMNELSSLSTIFIGGSQDKLTPVKAFKNKLNGKNFIAKIKTIPLAGHFCWIDAPKQLASELLQYALLTKEHLK